MSNNLNNEIKQEIVERLLKLDEEISLLFDDTNIYYEIVIVGGGALVLESVHIKTASKIIAKVKFPKYSVSSLS